MTFCLRSSLPSCVTHSLPHVVRTSITRSCRNVGAGGGSGSRGCSVGFNFNFKFIESFSQLTDALQNALNAVVFKFIHFCLRVVVGFFAVL